MKIISTKRLTKIVNSRRVEKNLSIKKLSDLASVNRSILSRIEINDYIPSIQEIKSLSSVLDFGVKDLYEEINTINPLINLKNQALNKKEEEGLDRLFSMMLTINIQLLIRKSFDNSIQEKRLF